MLRDRRAIVDTGVGPVAFVTVNALAGLETAAAVAVGIQLLIAVERLIRRRPVTNAIGGLLGTGLAVFIALRSGSAEGYFVPRMIYAAVLSLVFAGSVVIRRPLVGDPDRRALPRAVGVDQRPRGSGARSREVTLAWAGLFAFRAIVYLVLISAGKAGWLAVASVAMGWPAFLLLLFLSYRYVPRRLEQLGAPRSAPTDVEQLRELGGRHRPRQVEALPVLARLALQELELLRGLDALGDDVEAELARQAEHRGDERGAARVLRHAGQERAVELEVCTVRWRRRVSDEKPAPKSSIATRTPSSATRSSTGATASGVGRARTR